MLANPLRSLRPLCENLLPPILHRCPHLLILNKPSGMAVLADRDGEPCLWDILREKPLRKEFPKPAIVHRIDKGTSGVLAIALSDTAQRSLTRQFNLRETRKGYAAVVQGRMSPAAGVIDLPLKPGRKGRFRIVGARESIVLDPARRRWVLNGPPMPEAHPSQTHFRMAAAGERSLVVLRPHTGRTHQIRVHLAWLGHPIAGDNLYGKPDDPAQAAPRLMLHAHRLGFWIDWETPRRWVTFRAPLPAEFNSNPQ